MLPDSRTIACDGCGARLEARGPWDVADMRGRAEGKGWWCEDYGDYCPSCKVGAKLAAGLVAMGGAS